MSPCRTVPCNRRNAIRPGNQLVCRSVGLSTRRGGGLVLHRAGRIGAGFADREGLEACGALEGRSEMLAPGRRRRLEPGNRQPGGVMVGGFTLKRRFWSIPLEVRAKTARAPPVGQPVCRPAADLRHEPAVARAARDFRSTLLGGLSRGRLPVPAPAGYAIASARWDVALPPGPCGPQATRSEGDRYPLQPSRP